MVLRRWLGAWAVFFSLACVPRTPPVHLASPAPAMVLFVRDHVHDPGVSTVPEAFREEITRPLAERNLQVSTAPFDGARLEAVRGSAERLAAATPGTGDAEWILLVETQAEYFSQIDTQYRWTVSVKLSLGRKDGRLESSTSFTVPAFLRFDHEKEDEALVAAAPVIAERCGLLLDTALRSSAPPTPAP